MLTRACQVSGLCNIWCFPGN